MSTGIKNKENYSIVDLLKFLFSIFIVVLHADLLNVKASLGQYLVSSVFLRLAVPYFFAVSGFFFAKKYYNAKREGGKSVAELTKSYCLKLIPPLVLYSGIGLLFNAISAIRRGGISKSSVISIAKSFVENLFYPLNAMWYLLASVIGIIILVFIFQKFKKPVAVWAVYSIIGFSFVLLCNNYYFILPEGILKSAIDMYIDVFVSARNGVFLAPVYMGMGFVIADEKVFNIIKAKRTWSIALTALGFAAIALEAALLRNLVYADDRAMYISHLLLIPSLVCFSLTYSIKLNLPYITLRRLSTSIYYMHATVIRNILPYAAALIPILKNDAVKLAVTLCSVILFSLIIYRINSKKLRIIFG